MWVSRQAWQSLQDAMQRLVTDAASLRSEAWHRRGEAERLAVENSRLRADMDWFKLRLNQVERERGQLIQAAIGVKIAVPEFVPTYEDPGQALQEIPDLSTIGGDAKDQGLTQTEAELGEGVDYTQMPGYKGRY